MNLVTVAVVAVTELAQSLAVHIAAARFVKFGFSGCTPTIDVF